jgi:nucleolar complex protein 2
MITLGTMDKIPSATYFPLKFHLVRSCLRISRATGNYIPLATPLLEVLNAKEMKHRPNPSKLRENFDFSIHYRTPDSILRTRAYQDGVGEQVVELVSEFFLLWARNIAFPEFSLPVVIHLKRWLKLAGRKSTGNRNAKINSALVVLVQKLEANAKFVEGKRAKVDFAPSDRAQVDAFLKDFDVEKTPLGVYVVGQRKVRAEKGRLMEKARKEDEKKRKEEEQEEAGERDVDMALESDDLDDEELEELEGGAESDSEEGI